MAAASEADLELPRHIFTDWIFLQRLFEQEIPEIADGIITVNKVVRIPGEKAKVAVDSFDERIDAVRGNSPA